MGLDNLISADLNLLLVLKVLLEERNVTRAAERLKLSQPAVSRSLGRLRTLFNDPLFTRSPKGLSPSPRALALEEELLGSLQTLSQLIDPPGFEPASAQATFRLAITDYCAQVFLPKAAARLMKEAPGVTLELMPMQDQVIRQMEQDDIDLAIGVVDSAPALIRGRVMGQDKFVCAARKDHPLSKSDLTLEAYLAQHHALMTMNGGHKGVIDHYLEQMGLERTVTFRTPHFIAAVALVANSDLLVTLPYGLAQYCVRHYDLAIFTLR